MNLIRIQELTLACVQSLWAPALHRRYSYSQSWCHSPLRILNQQTFKIKNICVNNKKGILSHLQQHVARFDASIGSHGSSLHDGADVNTPVAPFVALAHDADTQKVVLLCQCWEKQKNNKQVKGFLKAQRIKEKRAGNYRPMFRVTVMMFSDIVESVMLLKEEACNHTAYI